MSDPLDSPLVPAALRDALRHTPDNVPLLVHVADTVLRAGGAREAEQLFKRALACDPAHTAAKVGLAAAFFGVGKRGEALVLVESLIARADAPAAVYLLHARLALQAGEPQLAARQYLKARKEEPALADAGLEKELAPHLPVRGTPVSSQMPPPLPVEESSERWSGADEESAESAGADGEEPSGSDGGEPVAEVPAITFADVGGMEQVKQEVRMKILLPLQQPELFQAYGKKAGGGILLYGPPGCGKTHLARATAGEVKAGFIAVGINDVLEMWIGQSERNLHALFEHARSHRPSVLFFDEVDALGANRSDMLKSGGRHLINQFLAELDGVQAGNEGVLVLAATNAPWHLDPAFRRPGRFDRILFVPPPDAPARAAILRLLLRGKPVEPVDYEALAKKTDGFSGADLAAVVDVAVEAKLGEAMKTGVIQPLTARDLVEAARRHKPTVRDWFETARNHALYANQSGLYDDVLAHLGIRK